MFFLNQKTVNFLLYFLTSGSCKLLSLIYTTVIKKIIFILKIKTEGKITTQTQRIESVPSRRGLNFYEFISINLLVPPNAFEQRRDFSTLI